MREKEGYTCSIFCERRGEVCVCFILDVVAR